MNGNKVSIFIVSLLTIAVTFLIYQNNQLTNENLVLKLKSNSLASAKKKAITWNDLNRSSKKIVPRKFQKNTKEQNRIADSETSLLMEEVQTSLKKHWFLKSNEIDKKIQIVNELILRNPNVYSSYKAKLFLLLTKESKKIGKVDDFEIEQLLTTMSEFDVLSDETLKKEALLIASSNSQIDNLFNELEEIDDTEENQQLIEDKIAQIDELEAQQEIGLLNDSDFLNENVIEIPLYRSLAKNDYDYVIEQSEDLLNDFPNSLSAHFFLIRALELSGRSEDALEFMSTIELNQQDLAKLKQRLDLSKNQNPKDYWKYLRF